MKSQPIMGSSDFMIHVLRGYVMFQMETWVSNSQYSLDHL